MVVVVPGNLSVSSGKFRYYSRWLVDESYKRFRDWDYRRDTSMIKLKRKDGMDNSSGTMYRSEHVGISVMSL